MGAAVGVEDAVIGSVAGARGWAISGPARPINRPDNKKNNLIENE
jgi:hypothetical protein